MMRGISMDDEIKMVKTKVWTSGGVVGITESKIARQQTKRNSIQETEQSDQQYMAYNSEKHVGRWRWMWNIMYIKMKDV